MVETNHGHFWTSPCHIYKLYIFLILLSLHILRRDDKSADYYENWQTINILQYGNYVYDFTDGLKEGRKSWQYLRENDYPFPNHEKIPLRVVVIAMKGSGDEVLFNLLKQIPGAYFQDFPFEKLSYRPMNRPDTTEASFAANALLDLSNCNHSKILGKIDLNLTLVTF